MGKSKNKTESITERIGRNATYVYLIVMLGLYAGFYPGSLYHIVEAKAYFFIIATAIYVCIILIPTVYQVVSAIKEKRKIKFDSIDLFAAIYLLAILFSTICAWNKTTVIIGYSGIRTGAAVMVLCLITYCAVKRYGRCEAIVIWAGLLGSGYIYLYGIFTACKVNFLSIQSSTDDAIRMVYVSPIGNIDFNASYFCIMLPAAVAMFLICKETFTKRVLAIYSYIGFLAVFCIRAESGLVTIIATFAILLYFALDNESYLWRYLSLIQIFIAANVTVYLLKWLLKDHMYSFDGVNAFLLRTGMILLELFLFALLFWLQQHSQYIKKRNLFRLQKLYRNIFFSTLAVGILFVLALNLFFREFASGNILNCLLLKDETFSGRGYLWIRASKGFAQLPVVNKIFGCGLACYHDFANQFYSAELLELRGVTSHQPHNDFLYVLINTGIIGVIGFFGMFISAIVRAVHKRKDREMQMMALAVLTAFLIQGLVNGFTIFIIPLVFIILGLADSTPKGTV